MKRKIPLIILTTIVLIVILGCSDDKIKLPEPPNNLQFQAIEKIDGSLSDYIEVVPGQYKFELEKEEDGYSPKYNGKIFVKFKFKKPIYLEYNNYESYEISLQGKALDKKRIPLNFKLNLEVGRDLNSYLNRGEDKELLELKFYTQSLLNSEEDALLILEEFKKGKFIRFYSEVRQIQRSSISKSENYVEKKSFNSNQGPIEAKKLNECDIYLIGYENFMKKHIEIVKKHSNNPSNPEVLKNYTRVISEVSKWTNIPEKCKDDIEFLEKLSEIQIKIGNTN